MSRFILLAALAFTIACVPVKEKQTEKIVSMSILPQKYFASKIAGEGYVMNVLIPPGAGHSNYEPSPSQLTSLSASPLYLQMGRLGFEMAWMDRFLGVNPDMHVVDVSAGISYITGEHDHGHEDCLHDESGADPHVWLSPSNAFILAENTLTALKKSFPEDCLVFDTNYLNLLAEISLVDSAFKAGKEKLAGKTFFIYHPALAYLAQEYSMEQVSMEDNGKEPTPSHLRNMVNLAKEKNIRTIFIQQQFSTDNAKTLASEIGGTIVSIDPLSENWKDEMLKILELLKE
jgi:zinc transport system substrate-binding protein